MVDLSTVINFAAGALGSYVTIRVTLATHAAKISNNTEKIAELKTVDIKKIEDNHKELEERVRGAENEITRADERDKTIFKGMTKLTDKIEEMQK